MPVTLSSKDPNEVLDYAIDWSQRNLGNDVVALFEATTQSGSIVVQSSEVSKLITTIWLSGGMDGETCTILLRITTAAGRVLDETVKIKIKAR